MNDAIDIAKEIIGLTDANLSWHQEDVDKAAADIRTYGNDLLERAALLVSDYGGSVQLAELVRALKSKVQL
jgi:hypothetical protein